MGLTNQPPDLLPGTLDLLILRTLVAGSLHGYGIAERLKILSQEVLQVGESSLYPALQRLLLNGWVKAEWGASENNRRARYYTLTAAGKKQLERRARGVRAARRRDPARAADGVRSAWFDAIASPPAHHLLHPPPSSRPISPRRWTSTARCWPAVARTGGRWRFGNATLAREDARGVWISSWLESVWQDVRYAARSIARQPAFAAVGDRHRRARHRRHDRRLRTARRPGRPEPAGRAAASAGLVPESVVLVSDLHAGAGAPAAVRRLVRLEHGTRVCRLDRRSAATSWRPTFSKRPTSSSPR